MQHVHVHALHLRRGKMYIRIRGDNHGFLFHGEEGSVEENSSRVSTKDAIRVGKAPGVVYHALLVSVVQSPRMLKLGRRRGVWLYAKNCRNLFLEAKPIF